MRATPPAGRANHMGISLIVTKSIDREYNETGDAILKQEWMAFVSLNDPLRHSGENCGTARNFASASGMRGSEVACRPAPILTSTRQLLSAKIFCRRSQRGIV